MGLYNTPSPFYYRDPDQHNATLLGEITNDIPGVYVIDINPRTREYTTRGTFSPSDLDCFIALLEVNHYLSRISELRAQINIIDTPRDCIVELGYHFGIWPRERDLLYQIVPYRPKRIFK